MHEKCEAGPCQSPWQYGRIMVDGTPMRLCEVHTELVVETRMLQIEMVG